MDPTALLVTTGLIALAVYDGIIVYLVPALRGDAPCVDRSVSRFMQKFPTRSPFVILVLGFLMGHFWGFFPCPECLKPVPTASVIEPIPEPEPSDLSDPIPVRRRGEK